MKLRIHVEPTEVGASYDDLLRFALKAEECGFEALFRSDHLLPFGARPGQVVATDAWLSLAGLARETRRIRLGTLVSPLTFRWPGHLAVQVAQADVMSQGRVELGLGTGWFAQEHRAYGIPFPDRRFERLEEHLQILDGLWANRDKSFSHFGRHYTLKSMPPPPTVQSPRPPIVVGGMGTRKTPALAGRYADEFNALAADPDTAASLFELVGRLRREKGTGRSGAIAFSVLQNLCCGETAAQRRKRAATFGEPLAPHAFSGSTDEVVNQLGRYAEAGATRAYLRILDLADLDQLELVASKVMPQLAASASA